MAKTGGSDDKTGGHDEITADWWKGETMMKKGTQMTINVVWVRCMRAETRRSWPKWVAMVIKQVV